MIAVLSLALASLAASPGHSLSAPQPAAEVSRIRVDVKKNGRVDAAITSGTLGEFLAELVRQKAIRGLILDESVRGVSITGDWSALSAEDLLGKVLAGRTDIVWAGRGDRIAVGNLDFVMKAWDVQESLRASVDSPEPTEARAADVKGRGEESSERTVQVDESAAAREAEAGARAQEATMAIFAAAVTTPVASPGTVLTSPFPGPNGEEITYVRGPQATPGTPVITPFGKSGPPPPTKAPVSPPPPPGSGLEALNRALGIR